MQHRRKVLQNILIINGFVILLVEDSCSRLREMKIWKGEEDYINIAFDPKTLFWIGTPQTHPPILQHSRTQAKNDN